MIAVVSGIPRSGTSLMMQMLEAGGIPALTDRVRAADYNNPRGYYETEAVKSLAHNPELVAQAEGKAVKIISSLLPNLPNQYQYKVIFMCRPLAEVVSSQDRMLERLGKQVPSTPTTSVIAAFEEHLGKMRAWLSQQPNMSVLYVDYPAVVQAPAEEAARIAAFLGKPLDVPAMARQVEQSLHRERSPVAGGTNNVGARR